MQVSGDFEPIDRWTLGQWVLCVLRKHSYFVLVGVVVGCWSINGVGFCGASRGPSFVSTLMETARVEGIVDFVAFCFS